MIKTILPGLLLLLLFSCTGSIDDKSNTEYSVKSPNEPYDSARATKHGADKYGMKTYVMAFLKRGPNPSTDSVESSRLQAAHMANISRLADEGKLVLAGPFYGNDSLRGIYIFDTNSLEEAKKMTSSDPAIQQGSLKMELKLWYGSAALMEINSIHQKITKEAI